MPRYANEGAWFEVEVDGTALIIKDAQGERTEEFESEDDAEAAYDDCVFDALQEGYRLTETPVDPKVALEATILAHPGDVEAHLVYADLLMSRNDPRGELIALHAEMLARPNDAEAKSRASRFRKEHVEEFYGDFQELMDHGLELEWKLGFVRTAKLEMQPRDWNEADSEWSTEEVADLLAKFLAHPSARYLRSLSIHNRWHHLVDEGWLDPIVAAIAETEGPWDALHDLVLSPDSDATVELTNGSLLFRELPALRSLELRCDTLHLFDLGAPALHRLRLEDCLSEVVMRALCKARWPGLRELELLFGRSSAEPEHVRQLLDSPHNFPELRALRLRQVRFTDELVDLLVESSLLPQLELLDLSGGSMTADAARTLGRNAVKMHELKRLDVSDNRLPADAIHDLRALPCKVVFGVQREDDDDDRFDGIQE